VDAAYPPLGWLELGELRTYAAVRRTGGPLGAVRAEAKMASVWALRFSRLLVALHWTSSPGVTEPLRERGRLVKPIEA
jgi:hypothetical protein